MKKQPEGHFFGFSLLKRKFSCNQWGVGLHRKRDSELTTSSPISVFAQWSILRTTWERFFCYCFQCYKRWKGNQRGNPKAPIHGIHQQKRSINLPWCIPQLSWAPAMPDLSWPGCWAPLTSAACASLTAPSEKHSSPLHGRFVALKINPVKIRSRWDAKMEIWVLKAFRHSASWGLCLGAHQSKVGHLCATTSCCSVSKENLST